MVTTTFIDHPAVSIVPKETGTTPMKCTPGRISHEITLQSELLPGPAAMSWNIP